MYLHQTGYLQNSGTSSNTSSTAGASSTSQTDKVSQIYVMIINTLIHKMYGIHIYLLHRNKDL